MSIRTNFDTAKAKINAEFNRSMSPIEIRKKGRAISTQQDVADLFTEHQARDRYRRQHRVLDQATLDAGSSMMLVGGGIFLLSMIGLYVLSSRDDLPHWATFLTAFLGLLGGWATLAGLLVRNAPNLPNVLTAADVTACSNLLDESDERHRPLSSPIQRQFAFLMLTLEAALLLTLLLPVVADNLSPNAQLSLTIPLAIFFGYLQWKLITRIVNSIAILRIRKKHFRLHAQSEFSESQTKATTIRRLYGDAVGQKWDRPTFGDHVASVLWCGVALLAVTGVCAARFYASDQGVIGVIAAAALAGLATVFFIVAIAAEVTGAVLIPDIATARRVIDRFPSYTAFEAEMSAQDAAFDAQLSEYVRLLRQGYGAATNVTSPGVPRRKSLDFSLGRNDNSAGGVEVEQDVGVSPAVVEIATPKRFPTAAMGGQQ